MAVSEQYRTFARELFSQFGDVSIRAIFSGAGVFRDDLMFGLIIEDQIYLKVDDHNRADYEAAGQGPYQSRRKNGRTIAMSFYPIPDKLYDDADELAEWAKNAFAAAQRGAAKKTPRKRKK